MRLDFLCQRRVLAPIVSVLLLAFPVAWLPAQAVWNSVGPAGGDARTLTAVPGQPNHLYLGATNSWIYETLDQGASWHRLSRVEPSEELVLDNVLVDAANPAVLYAGGWRAEQRDGGLWVSRDKGKQWKVVEAFRGQPVFSLTQAP